MDFESLEKEIKDLRKSHPEYGTINNNVSYYINMGQRFSNLKQSVRQYKKGIWSEILKDYFPGINMRTIQKYMRLGKEIDLLSYPDLQILGYKRIELLTIIAGKRKSISYVLTKNKIPLTIKHTKSNIKEFKLQVDKLLKDYGKI